MPTNDIDIEVNVTGADTAVAQLQALGEVSDENAESFNAANKVLEDHNETIKDTGEVAEEASVHYRAFGEGAKGLTGIFAVLARTMGVNKEVVKGLMEAHSGLREGMRALSELNRSSTEILGKQTDALKAAKIATEEKTIADEEAADAQATMVVGIGAAVTAIALLAVGIYAYIESSEASKQAQKEETEVTKMQAEAVKQLRIEKDKLAVLTGAKKQSQVDDTNNLEAYQAALDKIDKAKNDAIATTPAPTISHTGGGRGQASVSYIKPEDQKAYDDKIREINAKAYTDMLTAQDEYNTQKKALVFKDHQDEEKNTDEFLRDLELSNDDFLKNELQKKLAKIETNRKFDVIDEENSSDTAADKAKKIGEINAIARNNEDLARIDFQAKGDEQRAKYREKEKADLDKANADALKDADVFINEMLKKEEDAHKLKLKIDEQGLQENIDMAKTKHSGPDGKQSLSDKFGVENAEYDKTSTDTGTKYQAEVDEANRVGMDTTAIYREWQKQDEIDLKNHEENLKQIQKDADKAKIAEAEEVMKQVTQATIDALTEQSKAVQEANAFRIQQTQTEMGAQEALAEAGLKNNLAFEERRNSELEKQQIQQSIRQKKLKELSIFLNAVESFSKDSTNPLLSITKALALMAGVNATSATFAEEGGVIGEITARSMGRKHRGGGDVLLHAQTGEGILNRREMAALGGSIGFKNFRQFLQVPNYGDLSTVNNQVIMNDNATLIKKIESLQRTIENKPEIQINWDNEGNRIETVREKDMKKITKYKRGLRR